MTLRVHICTTFFNRDANGAHLAGVDADMDCGSVGLLSLHTLDVDDILFPVDLHYFADLLAFVVSTDNLFVHSTSMSSK